MIRPLVDMDSASETTQTPEIVKQAYDLLLQYRIVDIEQPLEWCPSKNGWCFRCTMSVPHPNPENVPAAVPLETVIPEGFPYTEVDFYSKSEEVTGFPHQSAETGKLCLPHGRLAPRDATRLVHYFRWAAEWLANAAGGTLVRPGDPYELPDFGACASLPIDQPVFFGETDDSYQMWQLHVRSRGSVECVRGKGISALIPLRFLTRANKVIWESGFSAAILDQRAQIKGKWLLLSDIRYERHRPPLTFGELNELCSESGVPFEEILEHAWRADNRSLGIGLILVGFPIPRVWNGDFVEIHWQPLLFQSLEGMRRKWSNGRQISRTKAWKSAKQGCFGSAQRLPWGRSTNVTPGRLYARGAYSAVMRSARVAVLGCGAVGSSVAESLARGGVATLDLFDRDILQVGNLCRHTLDGAHVGLGKAASLAEVLSATCPLSSISGHFVEIPLTSSWPEAAQEAVATADLLIDCMADQVAFEWLDGFAAARSKRLVSMFLSFRAEFLTLCVSGSETSCGAVLKDLLSRVRSGQLPVEPADYDSQPTEGEEIIEGAGCWQPTFPALNAHIWMLTAAAVESLDAHVQRDDGSGFALLLRRNAFTKNVLQRSGVVEVVWSGDYP